MSLADQFPRLCNGLRLSLDLRADLVQLLTYDHETRSGHREVQAGHNQIGCLQALQHVHALLKVLHARLERTQAIRQNILELLKLRLCLLAIPGKKEVPNDLPALLSTFGMANYTAK